MQRGKSNSKGCRQKVCPASKAVHDDALKMAEVIRRDPQAAKRFFFREMRPKMSALAAGYNRAFNLDISAKDVSTATYRSCWENDWALLRNFRGETTLHAWISKIASQATYNALVEERFIPDVGATKAGDYRLTVRSIEDDDLRREIVKLVSVPDLHKALELFYVEKVDDSELAKAFGSKEEATSILKEAERTLIEQLLNTENPFAEIALSTKKRINPVVPWQERHDRIDESNISENHQALRDILSQLYNCEDWDENAKRFILSIIDSLGWDDKDRELWCERFFSRTPSKELAERYHVRESWINIRYSNLNKVFRIAVKEWWNRI